MSEHEDLGNEFPELKDKIHSLKISDPHFKKLFEEYTELNKAVYRAEHRIDLLSEDAEEHMRRERVHLKDKLFKILTAE
jgi:uncharacterized protein YdcH (DUF465 family)